MYINLERRNTLTQCKPYMNKSANQIDLTQMWLNWFVNFHRTPVHLDLNSSTFWTEGSSFSNKSYLLFTCDVISIRLKLNIPKVSVWDIHNCCPSFASAPACALRWPSWWNYNLRTHSQKSKSYATVAGGDICASSIYIYIYMMPARGAQTMIVSNRCCANVVMLYF